MTHTCDDDYLKLMHCLAKYHLSSHVCVIVYWYLCNSQARFKDDLKKYFLPSVTAEEFSVIVLLSPFASTSPRVCFSSLTHRFTGYTCVNTLGLVTLCETKDEVSHSSTASLLIVVPLQMSYFPELM